MSNWSPQVARLCQKTGCTPSQALEALSQGERSLLSALLRLEAEGQVTAPSQGGFYSTKDHHSPQHLQEIQDFAEDDLLIPWTLHSFLKILREELVENHLEFWKWEEYKQRLPVWAVLLLLPATYGIMLPLLLVAMFFGVSYRFGREGSFLAEFNPIFSRMAKSFQGVQKGERK